MRFHLDEHVDPAIAHGLRRRGIDVTTTIDANLASAPDELQLGFAIREARVIFTNDPDFLHMASSGTIIQELRTVLGPPARLVLSCGTYASCTIAWKQAKCTAEWSIFSQSAARLVLGYKLNRKYSAC